MIESEAVLRICSVRKVFLKILKNAQQNNCARVSFLIKLQSSGLQLYQKETLVEVFSYGFCKISKNNFSNRAPPVAASVECKKQVKALFSLKKKQTI